MNPLSYHKPMNGPFDDFEDEEEEESEVEFSYVSVPEAGDEPGPSQYEDLDDELFDMDF